MARVRDVEIDEVPEDVRPVYRRFNDALQIDIESGVLWGKGSGEGVKERHNA